MRKKTRDIKRYSQSFESASILLQNDVNCGDRRFNVVFALELRYIFM